MQIDFNVDDNNFDSMFCLMKMKADDLHSIGLGERLDSCESIVMLLVIKFHKIWWA